MRSGARRARGHSSVLADSTRITRGAAVARRGDPLSVAGEASALPLLRFSTGASAPDVYTTASARGDGLWGTVASARLSATHRHSNKPTAMLRRTKILTTLGPATDNP